MDLIINPLNAYVRSALQIVWYMINAHTELETRIAPPPPTPPALMALSQRRMLLDRAGCTGFGLLILFISTGFL